MSEPNFEVYQPPRRPEPDGRPAGRNESPHRSHHGRSHGCGGQGAVERFFFVSGICVIIWLMTGADYFWPMWVMLGTGIPALLSLSARRSGAHDSSARRAPVEDTPAG